MISNNIIGIDGFKAYFLCHQLDAIASKKTKINMQFPKIKGIYIGTDGFVHVDNNPNFYPNNIKAKLINKTDQDLSDKIEHTIPELIASFHKVQSDVLEDVKEENDLNYLVLKYGKWIVKFNEYMKPFWTIFRDYNFELRERTPILNYFADGDFYDFDRENIFYSKCITSTIDHPHAHCIDELNSNIKYSLVKTNPKGSFLPIKMYSHLESYFQDYLRDYDYNILMTYFEDLILNDRSYIIPYSCLKSRLKSKVAIRPVSSTKSFPGQVIDVDSYHVFDQTYKPQLDLLIVVSDYKEIVSEKRYFLDMKNHKIITSSLYSHDDQCTIDFDADEEIFKLFNHKFSDVLPNIIVADYALTQKGPRLLEINCPRTSGFYNCDSKAIIEALR